MELFKAFGRLAMDGVEEAEAALSDVEAQGQGAAAGLGDAEQAAGDAGGALGGMASEGASASEALHDIGDAAQTAGENISTAGGALSKFVTGPLAGLAAGAGAAVMGVGNFADEILDTARATGQSTDSIQQWRNVAERAGTAPDVITRAAERMNRELGATGEVTDDTAAALGELGLSAEQLAGMDADERMRALMGALSDVDDTARAAELGTEIFGRQWTQIAPVLADSSAELDQLLDSAKEYSLTAEELAQADEFREGMVELRQELRQAWHEIGLELMPHLERFADWLREDGVEVLTGFVERIATLSEWFGSLPEGVQTSIATFVALAAALGPILLVVGKLVVMFGSLVKGIGTVVGAVTGLTGAKAGLAATLGPLASTLGTILSVLVRFVPVVGAVVAAVTAVVAIFRNWDEIIDALGSAWDWLVDLVSRSIDRVVALFETMFQGWQVMAEGIMDGLEWLGDAIASLLPAAWDAALESVRAIWDALVAGWQAVAEGFMSVLEWLRDAIADGVEAIAGIFSMIPEAFRAAIEIAADGIDWILSRFDALREGLFSIVGNIRDAVVNAFREMTQWVTDAVQALYDNTIGRIRDLYQMLVGNSIIPDLRDDVAKVMWDMARDSEDAAGSMASGVEGELDGVAAPESALGTSGAGTHVDMRGAVFRDDKEMDRRLRRSGIDLGGF